jgi:GrpB-like predicted nucleotidyltransferase (UPF0157 family)
MPSTRRHGAASEDLARAGGHDAPVEIVAYDPAWLAAFEAERKRLARLLAQAEIHHFARRGRLICPLGASLCLAW